MAAYESGIVTDEYHLNAMNDRLRRLACLGMYVFPVTYVYDALLNSC